MTTHTPPEIKIIREQPPVVDPYQIRDRTVELMKESASAILPGFLVAADIDIDEDNESDSIISVQCTRMANIHIDKTSKDYAKIYFQVDMRTPADTEREKEQHLVSLLEILNEVELGGTYNRLKVSDVHLWWRQNKGVVGHYYGDEDKPLPKYSLISIDFSCLIQK